MNAWKQIEKEQLELGILVSTMPLCMSRRFPELMPRAYFEALYRQRRKQQNAAELLADRRSRAPRKRSPAEAVSGANLQQKWPDSKACQHGTTPPI